MERMTLREAAERCSRSITTLRRYIRSGRLHAEKRYGRFGPEYYVSAEDLTEAGLDLVPAKQATAMTARRSSKAEIAQPRVSAGDSHFQHSVPLSLYQDLQMKHEQLLVQYGMVRAGGLRVMELQAEVDNKKRKLDDLQARNAQLREEVERGSADLRKRLQEALLELEGRGLEVSALQEKVRALEMLTRNAVTNETIEKQFSQLIDQTRRVEEISSKSGRREKERAVYRPPAAGDQPDH
jgi:hypothetical protein